MALISCNNFGDKNAKSESGLKNSSSITENGNNDEDVDSLHNSKGEIMDCDFEKLMNDRETPQLAKDLINNTVIHSEVPMSYFDNLDSKDKNSREFYFKVITNSYNFSDGAYAEGLGFKSKEYVENNTKDFISIFDNKDCFNNKDLTTWANIVMIEFKLKMENDFDRNLMENYCRKLNQNCIHCSNQQKELLNRFITMLKEKWTQDTQLLIQANEVHK